MGCHASQSCPIRVIQGGPPTKRLRNILEIHPLTKNFQYRGVQLCIAERHLVKSCEFYFSSPGPPDDHRKEPEEEQGASWKGRKIPQLTSRQFRRTNLKLNLPRINKTPTKDAANVPILPRSNLSSSPQLPRSTIK